MKMVPLLYIDSWKIYTKRRSHSPLRQDQGNTCDSTLLGSNGVFSSRLAALSVEMPTWVTFLLWAVVMKSVTLSRNNCEKTTEATRSVRERMRQLNCSITSL